jgi:hypothetical protein
LTGGAGITSAARFTGGVGFSAGAEVVIGMGGGPGFTTRAWVFACRAGRAAGLELGVDGVGLTTAGLVGTCGLGFAAEDEPGKGGGPARLVGDFASPTRGDAASRASGFGSPDFSIPYLCFESRDALPSL